MAKATRKARNGSGSVRYDRRRRTWIARVTLGVDEHGRQIRRSTRKPTENEAQKWVDAELAHLDEQRRRGIAGVAVPKVRTVGEWLAVWLDMLPGTVSPGTVVNYTEIVNYYLMPTLGTVNLTELSPGNVTTMIRQLAEAGRSSNTQRLARSVLRRALRRAEIEGLVMRNVAALTDGVRLETREGRTLTPLQARRVLTEAAGDRLEAAYVVAITTGLRRGELLALHWSDLDLAAGRLTVRGTLKRAGGRLVIEQTKTRTSRRTVHLTKPVIDALRRRAVIQEGERALAADEWTADPAFSDLVFTTAFGTPIEGRNFARYLSTLTERAGLGHWTPHELRHSAASILLAMGVPLKTISEMLGHTSIRVTADIYAHLMEPAKAEAAEAMGRALFTDAIG